MFYTYVSFVLPLRLVHRPELVHRREIHRQAIHHQEMHHRAIRSNFHHRQLLSPIRTQLQPLGYRSHRHHFHHHLDLLRFPHRLHSN